MVIDLSSIQKILIVKLRVTVLTNNLRLAFSHAALIRSRDDPRGRLHNQG